MPNFTYVIVEIDKPNETTLYWNKELGWVAFGKADVFSSAEHDSLYNLPVGGKWRKFSGVGKAEA